MEGEINDRPLENSRKKDPVLKTVKKIIDRFVADDEALKTYFQTHVIIGNFESWNLDEATKNLKFFSDFKILFLDVVKGSEELEDFINWAYCDDFPVHSPEYKHKEYARNCLENHIHPVQFIEARFIEKKVDS